MSDDGFSRQLQLNADGQVLLELDCRLPAFVADFTSICTIVRNRFDCSQTEVSARDIRQAPVDGADDESAFSTATRLEFVVLWCSEAEADYRT